jgi:spore maturation protein CgeB
MSGGLDVVVLGLSLSSSWGNGHATTWRALLREFVARGHRVTFLERDVPWYASHRDLPDPGFCRLELYGSTAELERFAPAVRDADAVIVGSYVPEGVAVGAWALDTARGATAFYDIDTPVTLAKLERGDHEYLAPELIPRYQLYASFSGGPALRELEHRWGSPCARALYCSVDPTLYHPQTVPVTWDLGYLGTYSGDRQPTLERLLVEPARARPAARFVVAGPQYPVDIAWPGNVLRVDHVPPAEHRAFYNAQRFTLNVTRADMIRWGWSPSVRLFEAAACGVPIVSDAWEGLDQLFVPGEEIVIARSAAEVVEALGATPEAARRMGERARARVLAEHTAAHRAEELEKHLLAVSARRPSAARA